MKAGTVFDNPLLHFIAYGLANPTVVWALERGLYDEWCPGCRGAGFVTWTLKGGGMRFWRGT